VVPEYETDPAEGLTETRYPVIEFSPDIVGADQLKFICVFP
jgi:hypothetical protein